MTYCLGGPATVFNIYTDDRADAELSHCRAADPITKYHQAEGPDVAVVSDPSGWRFASNAPSPVAPQLLPGPPAWATPLLASRTALMEIYRSASDADMASLLRHARRDWDGEHSLRPSKTASPRSL